MYLLSQINKNPAITTVTKRGIFGGGRGLLSSSLRNIKALLIYETGSLGNMSRVVHDNSGFLLPFKDLALKFVHGRPPTSNPVFDDF